MVRAIITPKVIVITDAGWQEVMAAQVVVLLQWTGTVREVGVLQDKVVMAAVARSFGINLITMLIGKLAVAEVQVDRLQLLSRQHILVKQVIAIHGVSQM